MLHGRTVIMRFTSLFLHLWQEVRAFFRDDQGCSYGCLHKSWIHRLRIPEMSGDAATDPPSVVGGAENSTVMPTPYCQDYTFPTLLGNYLGTRCTCIPTLTQVCGRTKEGFNWGGFYCHPSPCICFNERRGAGPEEGLTRKEKEGGGKRGERVQSHE